jgi:hypothetical protein
MKIRINFRGQKQQEHSDEFLWTVRKPKTNHAAAHVSIDRTQPSRGTPVGKRLRLGVKIECRHRCSRSVQRHSSRDRTSSTHDAPAAENQERTLREIHRRGDTRRRVQCVLRPVARKSSEPKGGDGARLEGWLREHPTREPRKENTNTLLERPVQRKHRRRAGKKRNTTQKSKERRRASEEENRSKTGGAGSQSEAGPRTARKLSEKETAAAGSPREAGPRTARLRAKAVGRKTSGGGAIWDENQKKSRESRNLAPSADQMKTETQHDEKNAHGGAHGGD